MKFCLHFSLPDCLKLTLAGHVRHEGEHGGQHEGEHGGRHGVGLSGQHGARHEGGHGGRGSGDGGTGSVVRGPGGRSRSRGPTGPQTCSPLILPRHDNAVYSKQEILHQASQSYLGSCRSVLLGV